MSPSLVHTVATPATLPEFGSLYYAVRVGIHGQVGKFSASGELFQRGHQVVCRTTRGLEIGTICNRLMRAWSSSEAADGKILRRLTPEDRLLWTNLQQISLAAQLECQNWLRDSNSNDTLLEVEPLLDGRTLYFHFLTGTSAATEAQLARLVSIYQQTVSTSRFARQLDEGCGPGCGTAEATKGCGTAGACRTCAVSTSCATRAPRRS